MHTELLRWALIVLILALCCLAMKVLEWMLTLPGTDVTIRCTSCNAPAVLPWDELSENFDLSPLTQWSYFQDLGWRCPECGYGPPQRYPDLFPQDPLPKDDVH